MENVLLVYISNLFEIIVEEQQPKVYHFIAKNILTKVVCAVISVLVIM